MPVRQAPVVENNLSLASGAPGRVVCGLGLELFTGIVQNTGTVSANFTLELPGGVSSAITVPPGGIMKFRNIQLLSVRVSVTAIISILGVIVTYDTPADWLNAIEIALVDVATVFTVAVQGAARPVYYDRNPTLVSVVFNSNAVAPHAETLRASYVVPASRKAQIMVMRTHVLRVTAAAPVGRVFGFIQDEGSGAQYVLVELFTNGVGDRAEEVTGEAGVLPAARTVGARTSDASTGGTVDYWLASLAIEFDA